MRRICLGLAVLLLLCGPTPADDTPPAGSPLTDLAFLVGEFNGQGKHAGGSYDETFNGRWILKGTALEIRSKSTMGSMTVFEDLRVISWDAGEKRLRMRQWANGMVRVFAAAPPKDGVAVFEQTAHEGPSAPTWRYTFTSVEGGGFDYEVHTKQGENWQRFVGGSLRVQQKDPGKGGGLGIRAYEAEIDGMAAQVHHPDGTGPYPVIVFSPGGGANTFQGYGPYGRWFATWGYITVIVAFNDQDANERAGKFSKVIDWALGENTRDGSPLAGMVDSGKIAVAGHSRGAHAALIAARKDGRVDAVLALAPSGPMKATEGDGEATSLVVIGDKDQFLETAKQAYACQPGERFLVEIEGLGHMLSEREPVLRLVRRSTAFLNYALAGDARYREPLVEAADGLSVESAK